MSDLPRHWAVSVFADGENIVTIEPGCLSGRTLSRQDQDTIRHCAQHLLAFVGEAQPECTCDGGEQGEGLVSIPHEPHCALYVQWPPANPSPQQEPTTHDPAICGCEDHADWCPYNPDALEEPPR